MLGSVPRMFLVGLAVQALNAASLSALPVFEVRPLSVESVTEAASGHKSSDPGSGLISASSQIAIVSCSRFGYVSLAGLGVPPFALPSDPDDGGWILTGLENVRYLGQSYDRAIWSINGTVEPGAASGIAASFFNTALPNPMPPNNLTAGWWTDLDLTSAGNWYAALLTSGTQSWIVFEWESAPRWSDPTSTATFQIWMEENAEDVWFSYGGFAGSTLTGTVGAEGPTGTLGDTYYFNGTGTLPGASDLCIVAQIATSAPTLSGGALALITAILALFGALALRSTRRRNAIDRSFTRPLTPRSNIHRPPPACVR